MKHITIVDNKKRILSLIRHCDGISRTDIAKSLGLSLPSISKHIEKLIHQGHVYEDGLSESSGGRRPIRIYYNYEFLQCLNIIIEHDSVTFYKTNLKGTILETLKHPLLGKDSKELIEIINGTLNHNHFKGFNTLIVSLPGIIEETLIIKSKLYPDLEGVDMRSLLNLDSMVHLIVCNDVDCKVYGKVISSEEPLDSLYYISYETSGIGSGMYLNGNVHQGYHGYAGELGFLPIHNHHDVHGILFENPEINHEIRIKTLSQLVLGVMVTIDPQVIYVSGNNPHMNEKLHKDVVKRVKENLDLKFDLLYCDKHHEIQLIGMLEFAMNKIEMKI